MPKNTSKKSEKRKSDQYNDPKHNYLHYWNGRQYEHLAEKIAIDKLLKGKHFAHALDVGGGYGRLSIQLEKYTDKVTLVEPSSQQLTIAKTYLKNHPNIEMKLMQADDLIYKNNSVDLVTLIRVMHHLPNPTPEFNEIKRVLKPGGYAVIEVANYAHMLNRIKHLAKLHKLPNKPVDIRSEANKRSEEIAFVNHNPSTVIRQLEDAGLSPVKALSVSNLRSPVLKKMIPLDFMLVAEKMLQRPLSPLYFGPSIFFLVKNV